VADLNFVESEAIVEELEHIQKDPKKWEEFVAAKPKRRLVVGEAGMTSRTS
jgi:hypothetical protein